MTQLLDHTTFETRLNDTFRIQLDQGVLALELSEVELNPADSTETSSRRAFTLIFHGPPDPILAEGIHQLEHDDAGTLEIYLIPIISAPDRQAYQAIFN